MPVHEKNSKPLMAVSFDTVTYADILWFMKQNADKDVLRITPEEFLHNPSPDFCYINLVTGEMTLREQINVVLDNLNLDRFSYVHPSSVVCQDVSNLGIFVYPNCTIYPHAILEKDIILHAGCAVAHNVHIRQGTFISGGVIFGGNSHIGAYNWIGLGVIVYDKVQTTDHVVLSARSVVKQDITVSGTYGTAFATKKLFQVS